MAITQAFGIREVCHCVFTPEDTINNTVFTIDTAKMSSIEGSSTTVYAQGGSGNARLVAWEGEKTMTFTVEDALLTMESFAALTGAKLNNNKFRIYPHSFAGYYSITALTLVRTEDGIDHFAHKICFLARSISFRKYIKSKGKARRISTWRHREI